MPQPQLFLFTDASDTGWGASLDNDRLSGLWSQDVSMFLINHRELLAVLLAIRGFLHLPRGRSVSLFTDNMTALSYLRKEGGTCSSTLNAVAQAILRLCEDNGVRLLPQFVPGRLNVLVDSLSRSSQVLGSEWTLCMDICRELFRRWPVTVDPLPPRSTTGSRSTFPRWWIAKRRELTRCSSLGIISKRMRFHRSASFRGSSPRHANPATSR